MSINIALQYRTYGPLKPRGKANNQEIASGIRGKHVAEKQPLFSRYTKRKNEYVEYFY
jgi:hypothetical protein